MENRPRNEQRVTVTSGECPPPSFLELDRVALGEGCAETRLHVANCGECSQYVARLQEQLPIPLWVKELRAAESENNRTTAIKKFFLTKPKSWTRWLTLSSVGLLGMAALALLVVMTPVQPTKEEALTAAKGGPSVALYLKRGEVVSLWNGQTPLAPGDLLRLKVIPEGFSYVAVVSIAEEKSEVLYEGSLSPQGETLLPESWKVDGQKGQDQLAVILSRGRISLAMMQRAISERQQDWSLWTTVLVFPKNSSAPGGG